MFGHKGLTVAYAVAGLAATAMNALANEYVTNFVGDTVSVIPDGGGPATLFASGFFNPEGIAFNPAGGFYVDNQATNVIDKVSAAGVVSPFLTVRAGPGLAGLVTDGSGDLYVSLQSSAVIDKITPGGVISVYATGVGNPNGLCFDAAGDLFVADLAGNHLDKVGPGGGAASIFATLPGVVATAVDSSGNIYASSNSLGKVEKYSSMGLDLGTYATVANSYALAFDSSNDLLITASTMLGVGSVVYAVPSGGRSVYTFATGLDGPIYIAQLPAPVPEPASLFVIGIAVITLHRRRRSRNMGLAVSSVTEMPIHPPSTETPAIAAVLAGRWF